MNYYYLEGANKKGPFSKEEIINLHLSKDIWVYRDGMDKWKAITEVEELNEIEVPEIQKGNEPVTKSQATKVVKAPSRNEKIKSKLMDQGIAFCFKALCTIALFAMCIYNIVLANKLMKHVTEFITDDYYKKTLSAEISSIIRSDVILLSATILAIAIFAKSVMNNSYNNK